MENSYKENEKMRILELLLVLSCISLLVNVWFRKKISRNIRIATICFSLGIFVCQLIFEGYRWQMVFLYFLTFLLIIISFLRLKIKVRFIRGCCHFFAVLLIAVSIFLSLSFPVFNLPEVQGPYKVGTQTFHFIDEKRVDPFSESEDGKRELIVQVWYPAENVNKRKRQYLIPQDKEILQKYKKAFAESLGVPSFMLDYWKYIKSNAYEDARLIDTKTSLPVVLISHGGGTSRVLHTTQAENLASNGFIAIAIDHPYFTAATAFPDGTVTGFKAKDALTDFFGTSKKYGEVWMADLQFVLDNLEKINNGAIRSKFEGKLDLNNIGMMGHSFGGATAFNAVATNERIKAGINMDGTLYNMDSISSSTKPFMFIQPEEFIVQKEEIEKNQVTNTSNMTEEEWNELMNDKRKEFEVINQSLASRGVMMSIKGTKHYNFTDFQLFSNLLSLIGYTGSIDGKRGTEIINKYVVDFFSIHLQGIDGRLIYKQNANYPEVRFHSIEE
ncbi:hypothetical protein CHH83_06155 [Bacillus sp. 7586-K]|nr:hypothetical protein CHH83_06155 [Bacillus sp. 7586-K]